MRASTTESDTMVFDWKCVDCALQFEGELLPLMVQFECLKLHH